MSEKRKMLVVEDDRSFAKILNDWFNAKGFEVTAVHSGKDALDNCKKTNFDVVLLDALIPKGDGFQTCQTLRKMDSYSKIPIIMLTAIYKGFREADRAKAQCGATDFLTKPVNLLMLYQKVEEYLKQ